MDTHFFHPIGDDPEQRERRLLRVNPDTPNLDWTGTDTNSVSEAARKTTRQTTAGNLRDQTNWHLQGYRKHANALSQQAEKLGVGAEGDEVRRSAQQLQQRLNKIMRGVDQNTRANGVGYESILLEVEDQIRELEDLIHERSDNGIDNLGIRRFDQQNREYWQDTILRDGRAIGSFSSDNTYCYIDLPSTWTLTAPGINVIERQVVSTQRVRWRFNFAGGVVARNAHIDMQTLGADRPEQSRDVPVEVHQASSGHYEIHFVFGTPERRRPRPRPQPEEEKKKEREQPEAPRERPIEVLPVTPMYTGGRRRVEIRPGPGNTETQIQATYATMVRFGGQDVPPGNINADTRVTDPATGITIRRNIQGQVFVEGGTRKVDGAMITFQREGQPVITQRIDVREIGVSPDLRLDVRERGEFRVTTEDGTNQTPLTEVDLIVGDERIPVPSVGLATDPVRGIAVNRTDGRITVSGARPGQNAQVAFRHRDPSAPAGSGQAEIIRNIEILANIPQFIPAPARPERLEFLRGIGTPAAAAKKKAAAMKTATDAAGGPSATPPAQPAATPASAPTQLPPITDADFALPLTQQLEQSQRKRGRGPVLPQMPPAVPSATPPATPPPTSSSISEPQTPSNTVDADIGQTYEVSVDAVPTETRASAPATVSITPATNVERIDERNITMGSNFLSIDLRSLRGDGGAQFSQDEIQSGVIVEAGEGATRLQVTGMAQFDIHEPSGLRFEKRDYYRGVIGISLTRPITAPVTVPVTFTSVGSRVVIRRDIVVQPSASPSRSLSAEQAIASEAERRVNSRSEADRKFLEGLVAGTNFRLASPGTSMQVNSELCETPLVLECRLRDIPSLRRDIGEQITKDLGAETRVIFSFRPGQYTQPSYRIIADNGAILGGRVVANRGTVFTPADLRWMQRTIASRLNRMP